MGKSRPNRRRKLIVKKALQKKIVLQTTLFPIIFLALLSLAVASVSATFVANARDVGESYPNLKPLFIALFGFLGSMALLILFVALRLSRRVAGPTYRLMQSILLMRQGDFSFRVRLCKGDLLTELVEELNLTLDVLEKKLPSKPPRRKAVRQEQGMRTE